MHQPQGALDQDPDHDLPETPSLQGTLMLGGVGGRRRRGRQRMRWLEGITDSMDMSLSEPGGLQSMGSLGVRHD